MAQHPGDSATAPRTAEQGSAAGSATPAQWFEQAVALHRQGRLAQAEDCLHKVLSLDARHLKALNYLAGMAFQAGHYALAIERISQLLNQQPANASAHHNKGLAHRALGQWTLAVQCFERAIACQPDYALAHYSLGTVLAELKQSHAAIASYNQALQLQPDHAQASFARGNALAELQQHEAAIASYDLAIRLQPDFAKAYFNRGNALTALKQSRDAIASYVQAIHFEPEFAQAHNALGSAWLELDETKKALACYDRAVQLQPDYADAFYNRGNVCLKMHALQAAVENYEEAIRLQPDHVDAHWNQGIALLLHGDYAKGWPQHEWREKLTGAGRPVGFHHSARWSGQELRGKSILLTSEQGLGDTIQFCRYATLVAARGGRVVLQVQEPLVELLKTLSESLTVISDQSLPPATDFHCPLMSLPLVFGTRLETVPFTQAYLRTDPAKSGAWKRRLQPHLGKTLVGLVWSGGYRADQPHTWSVHARRNMPLETLAQLRCDSLRFVSLQKGDPAQAQLREKKAELWPGDQLLDFTEHLANFAETAALVENLDLVISVDTSTAHLAGALGKPVWLLNRYDSCWRWMLERADSPWYPSMTIYRQQRAGDWGEVIARVQADLNAKFAHTSPTPSR